MNRKVIIGDIHGGLDQLNGLLKFLTTSKRMAIFLGDYVNRGADSKAVLNTLVALQREKTCTKFLWGNHDWALVQYLRHKDFLTFASIGGDRTLQSYLGENIDGDVHMAFANVFPREHLDFLLALDSFYEDEDVWCSHTGFSSDAPFARSFSSNVLYSHPEIFDPNFSATKMTICGHYLQKDRRPFVGENVIALDTGCGSVNDGPLSAVLLPEMQFIQVDTTGSVRSL